MLLNDKEIEQLKLHHELELKFKEVDMVNLIMGEFMKEIFKDPSKVYLPRPNVSSSFIFAKEDKFFLYPNNYNYYNNYYKDTFQHGGASLEEIICPVIRLKSR